MVLWFAGTAPVLVWAVLRDPAVDYRLVMLGALMPDVVDGPRGGGRELHSVIVSALVLFVVMLATRGRRHARRRWLAVPIGMFVHLLLDAAWTRRDLFWWPLFGASLADEPLPALDHGVAVVVVQEIVGVLLGVWWWRRFRLDEPARRAVFFRTGRLSRDLTRPASGSAELS